MNPTQWLCVTGNPFDGLHIYGPFDDHDVAHEWAVDHYSDDDWWLVVLNPPLPLD